MSGTDAAIRRTNPVVAIQICALGHCLVFFLGGSRLETMQTMNIEGVTG